MSAVELSIVFTQSGIEQVVRELTAPNAHTLAVRPVGISRSPNKEEFIVQETTVVSHTEAQVVCFLDAGERAVTVPGSLLANAGKTVLLSLPNGGVGFCKGALQLEGQPIPVGRVRVAGPRMPCISEQRPVPVHTVEDRFSRAAGALGMDTFHAFRTTGFAIIGLGRTGALVADTLLKTGAGKLALVDTDTVEEHNLDLRGVSDNDLGWPKVVAVGRALRRITSDSEITTCSHSLLSMPGLEAVKRSEIVVSSADHDTARIAAAHLSVLYHRPHLDIATGILSVDQAGTGDAHHRAVGADVRLLVPGDGCLLCRGGLVAPREAAQALRSLEAEKEFRFAADWRHGGRLGSLNSLNQIAVGFGVRLLEEFFSGTLVRSRWLHLEFRSGVPNLTISEAATLARCPLCLEKQGRGDAGLFRPPLLPDILWNL